MTEIKLTRNDNGKTVEAQVGDSVVIELSENPTTGYIWSLDLNKGASIVSLINSMYTISNNSGIGGGGMRKFILNVQSAGIATIEIKLRQPWEPESTAIDRFNIVIKAR